MANGTEPTTMLELFGSEKFLQRLFQLGLAAIFAGVLLGVFIGDVRADQKKNRDEHAQISDRITGVENINGQILMALERIAWLQLQQCVNDAKTTAAQQQCVTQPPVTR